MQFFGIYFVPYMRGKWISIEYRNREEQTTKYWIGIRNLDVRNRTLAVEGLHLVRHTVELAFDKNQD